MTEKTWINFREEQRIKNLLQTAAGPYGSVSKVARALVREGLERRGLLGAERQKNQDAELN